MSTHVGMLLVTRQVIQESRRLVLVAASTLLLVGAALFSGQAHAVEMFGGVGTTGVDLGIAERVGGGVGVRLNAEFLRVGRDFESDGATYDAKLKFATLGVYGDYFDAGGGFRLTAGAVGGKRRISGQAEASNGTITINGSSYSAAGESIGASAKFPAVAPYLGIGWGHHQSTKGAGFYIDLGVLIGKADAKLSPSPGLASAAGQANIDAEQRKLQNDVDKLKAYPVLKFGFSYAF